MEYAHEVEKLHNQHNATMMAMKLGRILILICRFIVLGLLLSVGCAQPDSTPRVTMSAPVRWEHGWKTGRVVATRYFNQRLGWNIGFQFPFNTKDYDRAEVAYFMNHHDGSVIAWTGRETVVVFRDVNGPQSADRKLQEILPELDELMGQITEGLRI